MTFERANAADAPALADLLNQAGLPAEALLEIDAVSLRTELFGFHEPRIRLPCHLVAMEKASGAQEPSSPRLG